MQSATSRQSPSAAGETPLEKDDSMEELQMTMEICMEMSGFNATEMAAFVQLQREMNSGQI
jgi:hypothetical protein